MPSLVLGLEEAAKHRGRFACGRGGSRLRDRRREALGLVALITPPAVMLKSSVIAAAILFVLDVEGQRFR